MIFLLFPQTILSTLQYTEKIELHIFGIYLVMKNKVMVNIYFVLSMC